MDNPGKSFGSPNLARYTGQTAFNITQSYNSPAALTLPMVIKPGVLQVGNNAVKDRRLNNHVLHKKFAELL